MPGSLANAAPSTVMPASLCVEFERAQEYPLRSNQYSDGSYQATLQGTVSRKRWRLRKKLSAVNLGDLRNFYDARKGRLEPFYFYDPYESSPKFTSDSTGTATTGRYTVRFDNDWSQSTGPVRSEVEIVLIEVA